MAPPKINDEIRRYYEAMANQSLDPNKYSGAVVAVVCEVITAETFIAGIASKILDGSRIEPIERPVVETPLLLEGRWWRGRTGQVFDTQQYPELQQYALCVESLRNKCNSVLSTQ